MTELSRLTCLRVEEEVAPVWVSLHEAPVEQLVDSATQHQPRNVISDLLRREKNNNAQKIITINRGTYLRPRCHLYPTQSNWIYLIVFFLLFCFVLSRLAYYFDTLRPGLRFLDTGVTARVGGAMTLVHGSGFYSRGGFSLPSFPPPSLPSFISSVRQLASNVNLARRNASIDTIGVATG